MAALFAAWVVADLVATPWAYLLGGAAGGAQGAKRRGRS